MNVFEEVIFYARLKHRIKLSKAGIHAVKRGFA